MKMDRVALYALRALLVLLVLPQAASARCPRPCSCPLPAELHCTFRSLVVIPAAVSKHVERMNLGFNSINKITDKSLAGLRKLELLMVHGNDIHDLPDGVFRDLASLQMLKMSYNKLTEINRHTLRGLWSLARLHLDHNRLEFIHPDAFHGLTSLRLLQLEGNRLQQLHPATFTTFAVLGHFHVSTLRHLYLSDNGLTSVPSRLLAAMPQLENLYLHGNPWTCDCNMKWLHDWNKNSPGVLKCKKDKALPGGQLCPMCSSPRHLRRKEIDAVENLVCSSPVIRSPHKNSSAEDVESEVLTKEAFKEPFGNVSLGLSDEHGNEVDLECSTGEPREMTKINWEQVDPLHLAYNITLSVDLECPVDREKYEKLWRLIAYYSSTPAHLERGVILSQDPYPTYVYRQDSERDALYYTGVKMNMMAQPEWIMQTSLDLQLNRLQSSAKMVKLILSADLSETAEVELLRRQRRTWVMIEETNTTRKVITAILGGSTQMRYNVHSSGQPIIRWMLPDASKLEAPYGRSGDRVSVSSDGMLVIKDVSHSDTGVYYCISRVHEDFAVMPFHLTVQESSSPPPGEDTSVKPIEGFAGSPLSLPCITFGSPDADINWILPSGNIVSSQTNSSRTLVYPNGTLHITQLQVLDSGYYKCIAMNLHGVDTLATKVTVVRRKGLMKPLRKFPSRPQSASGVNTQIKVPTENAEEASGDTESQMSRLDLRRRIPGSAASNRRGNHPSRNMWRRPPVLRKPTGSQVENVKNTVEGKRRINMSKSKIDPEKWADILAKIRDRNPQNTVTPLPVQNTTVRKPTKMNQSQETDEGSSEGMLEKEGQDYFTTPSISVQNTQKKTSKHTTQSQDTHVTLNSYTAHYTHDITSNSQQAGTTEPPTTQSTSNTQLTTLDTNLGLHSSSNSVFFLPQTTSAPLHTVTFWQARTNIASGSITSHLQEIHGTDVDGVTTADWFKATEKMQNADRPNVIASSNNDREASPRGSQIIPSVNPNESAASQDEDGKYETATASQLHTQLKDTTFGQLQSEAMLTTVSLTTTLVPTTARRAGAEEQSPPPLRQPNSRRRNGGRRRRPNRRKQKLNESTRFIATTPANAPLATAVNTPSTNLKIDPLEVTAASFGATVPFTRSQVASSDRLSHKENTVSGHGDQAAIKASSPASSHETKNSDLFRSTSLTTSFPTLSPGEGHGNTSPQMALEISESVSHPESFSVPTSTTPQVSTETPPLLVEPSEETQSLTGDFGTGSGNTFGGFHTVTQTYTEGNLSGHQHTLAKTGGEVLLKEIGMDLSPLTSQSTLPPSFSEHEIKTSGYTHGRLSATATTLFDYFETEQATTKAPEIPEHLDNSSSQKKVTASKYKADENMREDVPVTSTTETTPSPTASSLPDPGMQLTVMPYIMLPETYSPEANMYSSPKTTTKDTEIKPTVTLSEPRRTSKFHPATQTPGYSLASTNPALVTALTSRRTDHLTTANAPTITTSQSNHSRERSTQAMPRKHQLPGQGSIPRGKPRITKSNFQTFTVKAETDAQLPCEAEGEPMPFLSWIKVSSGAVIAKNSRVQRFEVHSNGTLTIRNTQLMDRGQYLCTVQNQYGTDKMVVNLVVLSQHPRVLHPRHRDITVHLGSKVSLECKVVGHPLPRVTWVLPNNVHLATTSASVPSQQHVAVVNNGTLQISQASYTDRGIYKCIGSSAAGADTVSVRLSVSALPPVIQQAQLENTTFTEGSTVYLHCIATGVPQPVIQWTTPNGMYLTASQSLSQNLFVFPNGTLYIKGLGPGNAGRYECSASNTMGSSKRSVMLKLRGNHPPAKASIMISSPQKTEVIYGSKLLLTCEATGEPVPRIIWRTPSKKLVDAQYSYDPRIKVFPNGTITIHSVTDEDSGDYLCVARNKMGDDYVLLRVNVMTKPAKIEQKQQRSSQEVVYGGDLKVDCVASGLPVPEISWALPDGTMVNPVKQRDIVSVGRSRRYVVFDNGTLYFKDVGTPEEGDYTCYAENQIGKDEMKVRVKVKGASYPPQILDNDPKTVHVFYGETVTLRCNAKGQPVPVITWISPTNKVISPALDKHQILDDGTLVVQKVQRFDGGNYTCVARNSAGQDYRVTRLEVLVTPPVINGLKGTTNSIKVTAAQDQQMLMDCVAKGTPTPRVIWVLPGNVILPAPYYSKRITVHLNGTLEIRSPKRTDSGQLICIARNEGGEVKLVVNLDVKEVVKRSQIRGPRTENLSLTVGNAMTLNCSFEGLTLPHMTWILPNGTPLHAGAQFSKFFHRFDGSLIISNPSIAEAGVYRCFGHNSGVHVERTITLLPGRKPEIINRSTSPVSVMNGETLLLHCQTTGEPLRLAWTLPTGVVLNRPQRAGRYAILPNGTLAIQQVSVYDRGPYVCRATNEYGSTLLSVSVTVIAYPPRITSGPPSVTYAKRGVAVQLNCIATGIPQVELAWETPEKNRLAVSAQPRLFGNKYLHPQGALIIQNPTQKDAGMYRCTARNALGIDSKATFLNVF
ncbi:matrix-remodeling-associated protein 5 [Mugil cephalus]|uniref:matrix-remodeling-associated protein 5 n=1 Tax=Mugil cephalus TaxID=48193 RepID=UPI001FB72349|nr:matrix-remodeling-associated protein 5 [Mugil cephalus]